jgi:hypothetical protein
MQRIVINKTGNYKDPIYSKQSHYGISSLTAPYSKTFFKAKEHGVNRLAAARMRARKLVEEIEEYDECAGGLALFFANEAISELLYLFKNVNPPLCTSNNDITDSDIESARQYPITNMIQFTRNKALCIFHPDKNPSLHYLPKTNRVKCHACGEGGDAIRVFMHLNNVNFIQAIRSMQYV